MIRVLFKETRGVGAYGLTASGRMLEIVCYKKVQQKVATRAACDNFSIAFRPDSNCLVGF